MRAIMVMFDSLNRRLLQSYGCQWTKTPNFLRLARHSTQFNNAYVGSMPCMPARRELHTGRPNFLHRSWGPIEPFDDSMPELLKNAGICSHLVSDHQHYWEDGGGTYHTRYSSWECVRGQEGEAIVQTVRNRYAALLEKCDTYLGKVLDKMDFYNMWQDTMLIVCTGHGFCWENTTGGANRPCPATTRLLTRPFTSGTPALTAPVNKAKASSK